MATGSKNDSLAKAKAAKQGAFDAQLSDIEAELQHPHDALALCAAGY